MDMKKIIPRRIKQYIKKKIGVAPVKTTYEYVIKKEDVSKLAGKRIIVTGATGAIGSALTHLLLMQGAVVGVCGRDQKKVSNLIERLSNEKFDNKGKLVPLYLDVSDCNSIEKAVDEFVQETGGLDAFINNAGGGARQESKYIHEQSIEVIDRVINVNLRGTILCARKAAQKMIDQGHGVIINMSSVVGMRGKEKMSDYAAAKAGIIGFTQSLALELGKYNIRVNCVSPGMVNQHPFDAGDPVKLTSTNCLKRFGYTDEVASVISFLVSDDAKYITGQNVVVDGGRSLGLMGDS